MTLDICHDLPAPCIRCNSQSNNRARIFLVVSAELGQNALMLIRLLLALLCANAAFASESDPVLDAAKVHARTLAKGHGQEIRIEAGPLDSSRLTPCDALQTYTPQGARSIGRTHVGVRCLSPTPWNILVPVRIAVIGEYLTARRALVARQTVGPDDLATARGDLAQLPTGTITDPADAIGRTLRNSVVSGQVLRADQLIAKPVIRQGQQVRVLVQGDGYAVRSEGKALNNAAPGEIARIKMPSGRTISGTTQNDGTVLLPN